jgi:hypothetical protein
MKRVMKKYRIVSLLLIGAVVSFSFVLKNDYLKSNEIANTTLLDDVKKSFVIRNSSNVSIPIETIDKVHKFEINKNFGGFRCITTGNFGATDYGPYCELYFIFDNTTEMPHRNAVFHIGNVAAFSSFKKVSETEYQITGEMFSNGKFETNEKVLITIDTTKLLEIEKKLIRENNDSEGDLESEILVSIINLN